jgi:hypothetical protein
MDAVHAYTNLERQREKMATIFIEKILKRPEMVIDF